MSYHQRSKTNLEKQYYSQIYKTQKNNLSHIDEDNTYLLSTKKWRFHLHFVVAITPTCFPQK